jgi:hypothetical protein
MQGFFIASGVDQMVTLNGMLKLSFEHRNKSKRRRCKCEARRFECGCAIDRVGSGRPCEWASMTGANPNF